MQADNEDTPFGLYDLGMGFPETGYISHRELINTRTTISIILRGQQIPIESKLEKEKFFQPIHNFNTYLQAAAQAQQVTEKLSDLSDAAQC